nr:immunoglobulin light chain junction region [Macaca mulatta]MOV61103.1 immunoglobulin light chain junction region [Macaca mulatta]MOV61690.1 immunoglobulin light chain junction region [Macaca mulatta]MOV62323.1 immunoglobulin light chain junction region [Macaca mulatta]MOV62911.1 immunoglobulin light chain junction region [Macaca mulatta]
CQQHNRYPYSF